MVDWEQEMSGMLLKNKRGRWVLNDMELTAGSCCQVWIDGHWIDVRIEHDGRSYYAIPLAVRLHLGLHARFPSQWGD